MPVAEHLVAATRGRVRTLTDPEHATWLWEHLLTATPETLSLVLMPDHLHHVVLPGCLPRVRRILAGFTAQFGIRFDLCPPQPAASNAIARRMIRYGFFNPVRSHLVQDPFEWPWSTLRDLAGAAFPIQTALPTLAARLHANARSLFRNLTSTRGEEARPLDATAPDAAPLDQILNAVAAALRCPPVAVPDLRAGRRLVVQTCDRLVDAPTPSRIAALLQVHPASIRRLRVPEHPGTEAALRCLADPRLRAWLP